MEAVDFDEANIKIAEKQEDYQTLPVYWNQKENSITMCFELSPDELEQVGKTGKIYFKQFISGPMYPIAPSLIKEDLIEKKVP